MNTLESVRVSTISKLKIKGISGEENKLINFAIDLFDPDWVTDPSDPEEMIYWKEQPTKPTATQLPATQLPTTQLPTTQLPTTQLPWKNLKDELLKTK